MTMYIGRAKITFDGTELDSAPGAKITLGGVKRTPVTTMYKVGYSESLVPATIECEIAVSDATPLESIRQIAGATVVFRTDIGKSWMVANAFVEDPLAITAKEGGKMTVKLTGDPAEAV
ncbi:phage tail tube protein [Insolitispirillum peregrinum]|uniref:phage tail tube protein n=1 Tax=Insolitispirillum peregrinum TaxID=80876 RepID=UPI0036157667